MSCEKCEQAQAEPKSAYYRWKNANIELKGCDEHLREIFEALNNLDRYQPTRFMTGPNPHECRAGTTCVEKPSTGPNEGKEGKHWAIEVASWGTLYAIGTEAEAEEWRRHKANWERSIARKREATQEEISDPKKKFESLKELL